MDCADRVVRGFIWDASEYRSSRLDLDELELHVVGKATDRIDGTLTTVLDVEKLWDMQHQPPGSPTKVAGPINVIPDLAVAMKQNPNLKIQLNGGYYDLATPYFAAVYELRQLPIQSALRSNIEMHFYTSGHMVYAHEPDLKALHANIASFIDRTKNGTGK